MQDLSGMRVAIIATDGFEQSELIEPRRALQEAHAEALVVAPKEGEIQGFQHFDRGDKVKVDKRLNDVNAKDFDAVMLPGGALNADFLRMDEDFRSLLQDFDRDGKPVAAICHAPWELVSAGLVEGRTLTSFYTIQDDIRNAGGEWIDQEVVEDGNWVTSRKPDDLDAFNEAMTRLFAAHHHDRDVRKSVSGREGDIAPM